MKKNFLVVFFTLAVALILAACAAAQPTPASLPAQQDAPNGANPANNIDNRLAVGTLKLEGTAQAVTADQAKQLLPLWQQVKSLSTSGTPAPDQLQTVYQQIQAAMTTDQMQTISSMSLNQADMQALMTSLGIQAPQGNFPTQSPEQMATRAARQTQNPNGGGFNGGGNANGGFNGTPRAGRTPGAVGGFAGGFGGGRGGGMNTMFIDPLIKLLQQRAGA